MEKRTCPKKRRTLKALLASRCAFSLATPTASPWRTVMWRWPWGGRGVVSGSLNKHRNTLAQFQNKMTMSTMPRKISDSPSINHHTLLKQRAKPKRSPFSSVPELYLCQLHSFPAQVIFNSNRGSQFPRSFSKIDQKSVSARRTHRHPLSETPVDTLNPFSHHIKFMLKP